MIVGYPEWRRDHLVMAAHGLQPPVAAGGDGRREGEAAGSWRAGWRLRGPAGRLLGGNRPFRRDRRRRSEVTRLPWTLICAGERRIGGICAAAARGERFLDTLRSA
ncbi:hypothetical protein FF041_07755 [Streptomyces jumonjinensis]|uniref:Uncharacterized protein n=1 Tax=Streptomyces jumonjinensis TaxID=1945 RepID=A0A646KCU7_STRJU|nr:hypothetical protein [Streptomyces jumonjinensis]